MVDEIRVIRLLRSTSDSLSQLHRERQADQARRADTLWLPGIKYLLITAIEACIDIAQHICSSERWGSPSDNGAAMRTLGERDVLPAAIAEAMRQAVGFRNVLVHEYIAVDDAIVLARLDDLSDLESFISSVNAWLDTQSR